MPGISTIGQTITASASGQSTTGLADNFDTFLTLLTQQLKNQDPLSPLDSSEFVNQLVQFSSVEQQISQNRNLETLVNQSAVSSATSAVSFIGKEVVLSSRTNHLQEGSAKWSYALDRGAQENTIVVADETGKIVYQSAGETNTGVHEFIWDGKDNSGVQLPDGAYTIQVAAKDADGANVNASISVTGIATGVDFASGEPALLFGSIRANFADILSVRERV